MAQLIREQNAEWVAISALAPGGAMHARDGSRHIRAQHQDVRLLVGLWNAGGSLEGAKERLHAAGATIVAVGLHEGLNQLQQAAPPAGGSKLTDARVR